MTSSLIAPAIKIADSVHYVMPTGMSTTHGPCVPAFVLSTSGDVNSTSELAVLNNETLEWIRIGGVPYAFPIAAGSWHNIVDH